MSAIQTRPTSVTVISWAWILLGIITILGGLMATFCFIMINNISALRALPEQIPSELRPLTLFLKNISYLAVVQFVFSAIAITSGIQFLKLRNWARLTIEGLTWAMLLYILFIGSYWLYMWLSIPEGLPGDIIFSEISRFNISGVFLGSMFNLIFGIPLAVMLVKLKSSRIKTLVT